MARTREPALECDVRGGKLGRAKTIDGSLQPTRSDKRARRLSCRLFESAEKMATAYADFCGHLVQARWITQPSLDDGDNALKVEGRKSALCRLWSKTVEPHHLDEELDSLTFHHDHANRVGVLEFSRDPLQTCLDHSVAKSYCRPQTRNMLGSDCAIDESGIYGNEEIGARFVALVPSAPLTVCWQEDHRTGPARREGNTPSFDKILTRSRLALEVYQKGVLLCGNMCLLAGQTGSFHDIRSHDTPIEMLMHN